MGNVSTPSPHGYFTMVDPYGGLVEGETLQCCHCGGHWQIKRGSGKVRGFCFNCGAHHCGGPGCDQCLPTEKRLEILEGTRNPTAVSVPVLWTPPVLWAPPGSSASPGEA